MFGENDTLDLIKNTAERDALEPHQYNVINRSGDDDKQNTHSFRHESSSSLIGSNPIPNGYSTEHVVPSFGEDGKKKDDFGDVGNDVENFSSENNGNDEFSDSSETVEERKMRGNILVHDNSPDGKHISLTYRQPSFNDLGSDPVPKGGHVPFNGENLINMAIRESDEELFSADIQFGLKMARSKSADNHFTPQAGTTKEKVRNDLPRVNEAEDEVKYPDFISRPWTHKLPRKGPFYQANDGQGIDSENKNSGGKNGPYYRQIPPHNSSCISNGRKFAYQPKIEIKTNYLLPLINRDRYRRSDDKFHTCNSGSLFSSAHRLKMPLFSKTQYSLGDLSHLDEEEEDCYNVDYEEVEENSDHEEKKLINSRSPAASQQSTSDSSVKLPPGCKLDLTRCIRDQGYDSEQGSSRIPPRLMELVVHPKESLTYLALCGVSIAGYRSGRIKNVIHNLNDYMNKCIENGYIYETEYLDGLLEAIKTEVQELEKLKRLESSALTKARLDDAKKELKRVEGEYKMKEKEIEEQREWAIEKLRSNLGNDLELIDSEWTSSRKQYPYSKPSGKILSLRRRSIDLLKARRYEEASYFSQQTQSMEEEEAQAAYKKMQSDYQTVVQRRLKKFDSDMETLKSTFDSKILALRREKENHLIRYQRKIVEAEAKHKQAQEQERRDKMNTKVKVIRSPVTNPNICIRKDKCLKLPPLMTYRTFQSRYGSRMSHKTDCTRLSAPNKTSCRSSVAGACDFLNTM